MIRALTQPRYLATVAAVTGVYVGAAKLGIDLSVAHGVITPVWAPTGIGLAALLLFGLRAFPAVALGAFVANATSGVGVAVAAAIAVGNTAESVVGAYVLRRLGLRASLARVRDVLLFVLVGGFAATALSATNGTTVLLVADKLGGPYGSEWLLWWLGDAAGALLVAPMILVGYASRRRLPGGRDLLEALALLGAVAAMSCAVFLGGWWRYPYLLFPFLIWAPLRFRQLGAVTVSLLVGALATAGVVAGEVPIGGDATKGVEILQALVGVVAVSLLVFSATLAERETATDALKQAQELTHIGSWEWNVASDRVDWSDELYRIFGLEPQSIPVTYASFLDLVHPGDRDRVDTIVRGAFETHQPFEFEHRVPLSDGTERLIHGRGRVDTSSRGAAVRMYGTAQDITQERQLERLRDSILATVSHELRTPLTAVLGFSMTLEERRRTLDDAQVDEIVRQMTQQARRLEGLLTDLLDLDRHRRGLLEVARRPTDLAQLVARVAAEQDGDRPVTVAAAPLTAMVDGPKVERIVENLLSNAAKHTPADVSITIAVERSGRDVLIRVDDAGSGIPDDEKAAVFEIFGRREDSVGRPGAGVGLSIVARLAELHGGKAWVEDAAGGGASFRVLLPDCIAPAA